MNRKEKELKALELFNLKVGDRVKMQGYFKELILEIVDLDECLAFADVDGDIKAGISSLFENNWEKIETPLKDRKCREFKYCVNCPLFKFQTFYCQNIEGGKDMTLEELCDIFEKEAKNAKQEILGEK